jgi:plasmid stability protein
MTSLTVRNLPEDAKRRFRQVAAAHGRSMEEHLRHMIIEADIPYPDAAPAFTGVRDVTHGFRHFERPLIDAKLASRSRIERLIELGRGLDLEIPPRQAEKLRDIDFS